MQMRGDSDGGGDNDQIFYYVLPFKGWHQKTAPCNRRQHEQRHKCHKHVNKQERYDCPLQPTNGKKNAYQHFKQTEKNNERWKAHPRDGLLEKLLHQRARRACAHDFQKPEPEENNKKTESRYRHGNPPEKMYQLNIDGSNIHTFI